MWVMEATGVSYASWERLKNAGVAAAGFLRLRLPTELSSKAPIDVDIIRR